ncbi:MAG: hypothetical protein HY261_04945 [Chloroflexi bacterium]|nr:hypothetical protein [Chloroflexota bacterium]
MHSWSGHPGDRGVWRRRKQHAYRVEALARHGRCDFRTDGDTCTDRDRCPDSDAFAKARRRAALDDWDGYVGP